MKEEIILTSEYLYKGETILYPTDTIWGLGCDATSSEACKKLYEIKKRSEAKTMLILVNSLAMLERYVRVVPEIAYELIEASVKPVTIIYPNAKMLAPEIIAEDGSIGIRVCETGFVAKLIDRLKKPVVSTSANISGEKSPLNFNEISEEVKNNVDYIVNMPHENTNNSASNIIKIEADNSFKIIR